MSVIFRLYILEWPTITTQLADADNIDDLFEEMVDNYNFSYDSLRGQAEIVQLYKTVEGKLPWWTRMHAEDFINTMFYSWVEAKEAKRILDLPEDYEVIDVALNHKNAAKMSNAWRGMNHQKLSAAFMAHDEVTGELWFNHFKEYGDAMLLAEQQKKGVLIAVFG